MFIHIISFFSDWKQSSLDDLLIPKPAKPVTRPQVQRVKVLGLTNKSVLPFKVPRRVNEVETAKSKCTDRKNTGDELEKQLAVSNERKEKKDKKENKGNKKKKEKNETLTAEMRKRFPNDESDFK